MLATYLLPDGEEKTVILTQLTPITKDPVRRSMFSTAHFESLLLKKVWVAAGYLDGQADVLTEAEGLKTHRDPEGQSWESY